MSYMTIGSNGDTRILPCHYEELSSFVIARLAKPAEAISGAMRLPRTLRVLATTG
jgi:hypothetical protein